MQRRTLDDISPRGQFGKNYDVHIATAEAVEIGLRTAAASRSLDNLTVLVVGLKGLKKTLKAMSKGLSLF